MKVLLWITGGLFVSTFFTGCVMGCMSLGCRGTMESTGFRDGTIQKFTQKGVIFKSWEGELALPGFQSVPFPFSVVDQSVVEQLNSLPPDSKIRIYYTQHRWLSKFKADQAYTADKIEIVSK